MAAKKIYRTRQIAACLVVGGVVPLAACGGDDPHHERPAFAVVVDVRRNSPTATHLAKIIDEATAERGSVTLIEADGKPNIVAQAGFDIAGDPDVVSFEAKQRKDALIAAYLKAAPDDAEADVLGAEELARRELSAADTDTKIMVVESSGVSTTGVLRHTAPGALYAKPEDVVDRLWNTGNNPGDADGITVQLWGIGDVAAPQAELTEPMKKSLRTVYRLIWERAGATVVIDQSSRADIEPRQWPAKTPPVTEIPIVDEWLPGVEPTLLPGAETFEPDSSELIDGERTRELLAPYVDAARRQGATIRLEGRTARDGDLETYQKPLGLARAEALKRVLVQDLGFPADRVTTAGVGSNFPEYVPDSDPITGELIPEQAALNRHTLIEIQETTR